MPSPSARPWAWTSCPSIFCCSPWTADGCEPMARRLSVLLLTAPAIALMAVFLVGPLVCVLALSFTNYQLGQDSIALVGFANYVEMASDETVRISLANTLIYVG